MTKREQTVLDGVQASLGQMIDTETAFIREPRRQTIPALVQAALDRRDTFQSLHRQVAALSADAALSTRAVEHTKQLLGDGDVNAG